MRILAMILVVIMTVQVMPLDALAVAFGELKSVETGIDVNTLKKEDAINWPIKIYDYLDDGMLFEWNDSMNSGTKMATGNSDGEGNTTPYAGGAAPVWTKAGTDYTYNGALTATDGNVYNDTIVEAKDFKDPRHLHIEGKGDGNTANGNYTVLSHSSGIKQADMRYIVIVYRGKGISNKDFSLTFATGWQRTKAGKYLQDSSTWRYEVIDLDAWFAGGAGQFSAATETRITFGFYATKRGLPSGAWFDLSHVAYFTDPVEADNYGKAAVTFDNNPGEYLRHNSGSFTTSTTTITYPNRPMYGATTNEYVFSLNQYWKPADGSNPALDPSANGTNTYPNTSYPYAYYGMDFTRTDTDKGAYTNAYTSHSYGTWASGANQTYKYTDANGVTRKNSFYMDPIGVSQQSEKNGATYVRLTTSGPSRILLSKFREDRAIDDASEFKVPQTAQVNYLVLVYRGNGLSASDQYGLWAQGYDNASRSGTSGSIVGNWKYAGLADAATWTTASNVNPQNFNANTGWQYVVVDINAVIGAKDADMPEVNRLARAGLYLPELSGGKSLDLAYVGYFESASSAATFGTEAAKYMNSAPKGTTTTGTTSYGNSRYWTTGNNKSFGMLYATGYGAWDGGLAGGTNTSAIGYDSWMIGYHTAVYGDKNYNTNRRDPITGEKYTAKYTLNESTDNLTTQKNVSGTSNYTYLIYPNGGSNDGDSVAGYDTSILEFDGYQLLEKVVSGLTTVGLLEGSLRTIRVDNVEYRVPVYRQETVEYIAYLLVNALRIPQRDANGNYYSNFISGSKSTQFGGVDLNGDGVIGMIDLDGDSRTGTNGKECDENSVDLATALRHCLGIKLPIGQSVGTYTTDYQTTLGSYEETLKKDHLLIGKFQDCRYSIKTAMDAAYYMLNSLFIANSFNQKQDDYYYLNMPMAQVTTNNHSGDAYVFDAGFTTGSTAAVGTVFTDTTGANQSAISYSPVVDANGKAGTGTIYLSENTTGKTLFNYSTGTNYKWTTRFPFLPVTDAEGDYAGQTKSYYYWDDDYRTYTEGSNSYIDRNYNYVLASNGEFVYKENENLFFEFEGDDDVYLFINGELVLDIGAGHSITSVYIDVNDYVKKAREVMAQLAKYGYTNDMVIEKFDAMIEGDTLEEYIYDNDGKITGTKTVKNRFSAEKKEEFKRWARLDLVDGQICQFDFYYMERHGWGANMRIVTNMHITDPSLDVDKTAYQYGQEIEYGGVIDPTASLEYNFSLTNSGNQKLYNLTFKDEVLGLSLDPTNGLTFFKDKDGYENKNGVYILDGTGRALEAKDLTAVVSGYNAIGQYTEVPVTFPEVDGDGGQTALKNFLKKLSSENTESEYDDAEITHAGSGLWVDATVTIKGIHYMLTPKQMEAGAVNNVVYLTATTRTDPNMVGNLTLKSDAEHLIYTSGFPVHYQWAGRNIFIKMEHLLKEAKEEAATSGTQLNLYYNFFNSVNSLSDIHYNLCDKYGRTGGYYAYHTKTNDTFGNPGYAVNYEEPGIYTFYLLLYKQEGANKQYLATGVDAEDIAEGEYAIVRSQVYVADVEDSVYVLDYGLSTQSLDVNGELFKNDHLFGPYGTIRAKLMGVSGTQPSYVDPLDPNLPTGTNYCRIAFQAQNLDGSNTIKTQDGIYKVNLAIPSGGKLISYDSTTGQYTLTGVGTVTMNAVVPTDNNWKQVYLYYWYDDGTSGPAWPGTPMKSLNGGQFQIDIPADVSNIIINNGSGALQTADMKITPGLEATIYVTVNNNNEVSHRIETINEEVNIHVKVPSDWEKVYLHHWHDNGESTEYPGEEITAQPDANGYRTITVHGNVAHLLINDGVNRQSGDLNVYAGQEAWIEVSDTVSGTAADEEGNVTTTYYQSSVKYTLSDGFDVHASVPSGWEDTVYIYYWRSTGEQNAAWPGEPMTKGDFGWYTYDKKVPADVSNIVINDGSGKQTVDLMVTPGLETWIMVNNSLEGGKYTARVAYGSEVSSTGLTFTPKDFMDESNDIWLAITVHSTSSNPSPVLITDGKAPTINIHNEVQMYKKISVLPASVIYYEDTFGAISYNKDDANSQNSFTHHGNGSGQLSQSIDQDQPYGQDAVYQGGENDLYSGGSLTEVEIKDDSVVATFTFKGTGFELISRTTAFDAGSFMARVYKKNTYTADAYEKYMQAANTYLGVMTTNLNVTNSYNAANTAWQKACTLYDAAQEAYNKAKELHTAANEALVLLNKGIEEESSEIQTLQQSYDDAYNAYKDQFAVAYTAFVKYEKARSSYVDKLDTYQEKLQAHTKKNGNYTICAEVGGCSYTNDKQLDAFETALVLGNKPAAPVAYDTLVTITQPTKPTSPCVTMAMVYTQFDHGNDGGAESLNQVPALRVKDMALGEYVVEIVGLPTYTFDDQYNVTGVATTKLYIDGVRIYQPLGASHEAYNDKENNANVEELRDLIASGSVGVATMSNTGLNVSTGTTTWTEGLADNDFDASNKETYNSIKVENTSDYLIQGPNNEVYMEGNATNSALIFYVKETGTGVHELQIAVRGLDYGRFYGAGSTGISAQLQYGVPYNGEFIWKNLVQVVSGTEQYYTIPYAECPMDTQGRYQIALRAINPNTKSNAMVSYTNLKLNGLTIEKMDGIGEGSIVYYQNGILVKPDYELVILEEVDGKAQEVAVHPITGSEISLTLGGSANYVYIRSTYAGKQYHYYAKENGATGSKATLYKYDQSFTGYNFDIIGSGDVTIKIKQISVDALELSCCQHTYGEGAVTREPNCSITGIMAYQCTKCDHVKHENIATNDTHHYSGGICVYCGAQEDKYYLVGYINGKNHGFDRDFENMGDYLFVDGKLEVQFEKDSYVFLKADGNAAWYMAPSYVTNNTATFYDTTTGKYTEKMYVPCGVKLIFTLTHNADGSKTLHYEEPCKHSWDDGQITVKATCTTDGERTYTCQKCFLTKVEVIPASGHNYVDGVCGCGDVEIRTIYFHNTDNWANVYYYAYNPTNNIHYTSKWPGDLMQAVEGKTNVYSVAMPTNLIVIFTNNEGAQTENLTIPQYGNMYDWSKKAWVNESGELDYYLVGSINGVDYGIGDTVNNMGSYRFVDGKVNVTFDKESYVMVKAIGNTAFYYCQTYCKNYSATLYNSDTGANEKMFIPGGTNVEFTLTVNDDGTLNLVAHSWFSVVTDEPTCTEPGEKTVTCYLCNDSYTEAVPANGHSFVDDICGVCGAEDQRIVYFKNTAGWENVYIYAFTEGTPADLYTGSWPGAQMSLVDGETDLYYYVISAKAKSVIFNNGTGLQTQNLHAPTGEANKYVYGANDWFTLDEEVAVPDQKIYLKAEDWLVDGAWLAAYFFEGDDANTWAKMTDPDGDGIYECVKPDGYSNVIFCRMSKENSSLSWDAKWNQTEDLTIPTDGKNFFTVTNPWAGNNSGEWSVYTCNHTYTEEITTEPGCETTGVKTFTCSKCGDKYTEDIEATGHAYQDGSCTVCGGKDPDYVVKVYLQPGAEWKQSDAWFAAWFTGVDTWATMNDSYGNGYYWCEVPEGATGVIFVRMSNEATAPNWDQKWNQTGDLSVEANRLFVIENPWNEASEGKATGSWTDYDATVAECSHSYTEEITTSATCATAGLKTFTCSKCGDKYTEEIAATGHNFVNGSCTNAGCNEVEPTNAVILYLKPNDNWNQSGARFAAYFFNNGEIWVDMTDADGDGIYQCEAPAGYPSVIFCRMNPGTTENNWNNKWNQTANLTTPTGNATLFTVPNGSWDGSDGTNWSTFTATRSLRSAKKTTTTDGTMDVQMPEFYIYGDENYALNLPAINAQMSSNTVYGAPDQILPGNKDYVVDIKSAALVLTDDICMNYYVTVPENAENVYMTFLFNGELTKVTDYTVCEDGRYCFRFSGIYAQKMGDNISATLYATVNGMQLTDCVAKYSVRTYCVNQLNRADIDAKTVRLISDLLVYGEKTQLYMGYKTDELVTEGLTLSPSTFSRLDDSFDKKTVSGNADWDVRYSGVTIVLGNKVKLRLTVKTDDPSAFTYTVKARGAEKVYTADDLVKVSEGTYYLYFDGLKATCFNDTVTASIQRDGKTIGQTVTYSVNTYILNNQDVKDQSLREMLEAVYNYGCSAAAAVQN